jgi:hypothetical protein
MMQHCWRWAVCSRLSSASRTEGHKSAMIGYQ